MASKKLLGFVKLGSGKFIPVENSFRKMTEMDSEATNENKVLVKKFIKIPCIKPDGSSEEISVPQRGCNNLPKRDVFLEPISEYSYKIVKKHSDAKANKAKQDVECVCRTKCKCYQELFELYKELKQKCEELSQKLMRFEEERWQSLNQSIDNFQNPSECCVDRSVTAKQKNAVLQEDIPSSTEVCFEVGVGNSFSSDIVLNNVDTDPVIIGSNVNMGHQLQAPIINVPQQQSKILNDLQKKIYMCWIKCDHEDQDGFLPIHHAVLDQDLQALRRQYAVLKLKERNLDIENNNGLTPLHLAVKYNVSMEITDFLLKYGATPSCTDDYGNNCFHLAASSDYLQILNMLNAWTNVDCLNQCNHDGYTPLMICVIGDKVDGVTVLLDRGVDLDVADKKSGRTALFYAVENNSVECVTLLLESGANTKLTNFAGSTVEDLLDELGNVDNKIKKLITSRLRTSSEDAVNSLRKRKKQADSLRPSKLRC